MDTKIDIIEKPKRRNPRKKKQSSKETKLIVANTNKLNRLPIVREPKNVTTADINNITEFLNALLLQDKPYVLPRYAGAYVAPHQFTWKQNFNLNTAQSLYGAFIITNDPDNYLITSTPNDTSAITPGAAEITPAIAIVWPSGVNITESVPFQLEDGTFTKMAVSQTGVTGVFYDASVEKFVPGTSYYPGVYTLPTAATTVMGTMTNTNGVAGNVMFKFGYINLAGQSVQSGSATSALSNVAHSTVSYDYTTNANWAAHVAIVANSTLSMGMWFAISIVPTAGVYQQGPAAYFAVFLNGATVTASLVWTSQSLWSLLPNGGAAAKLQYDLAVRHNVTGQNVVFSNNSAELIKGGNIYAARLPGNSFNQLPGTLQGISDILNSQVHHALKASDLAKGVSYSFTPEKLQDWLFERSVSVSPYDGNAENIPYFVCVYDASSIVLGSSVPTLTLKGAISIEYLSTDPSNFYVSSPSNSILFDAILNALACQNCVSENPEHLKNIKNVIKKVLTSDNLKMAIRLMIQAGVAVAPMVMSLL